MDTQHDPQAPDSGIPTTPQPDPSPEPSDHLWWRRTPAERQERDPERYALEQAERSRLAEENRARWTKQRLQALYVAAGERFADASLDNYRIECDAQRGILARLWAYEEKLLDHVKVGQGMVLYGGVGTGKTHLLAAMAKAAIQRSAVGVEWVHVPSLFRRFRDAMDRDAPEANIVRPLVDAKILILDDLAPAVGSLTPFQTTSLLEIVDARYRERRPTWCSLNVSSGVEADERLGAQIADRLRDGALTCFCSWPSYRRPWGQGDA